MNLIPYYGVCMNEKIVTKGVCSKCQEIISRSAAKRHISSCFDSIGNSSNAFLLNIQWPHKKPIYWLYLSVPFKSTLEDLDSFLRDIWLDCCSHLSMFTINKMRYSSDFMSDSFWPVEEESMSIRTDKVLTPGLKFIHEYDFGSTTELLLEVVGLIKAIDSKEIAIIIRNEEPEITCVSCKKKATLISSTENGCFCESCADVNDEELYLLPLVNSPRTGVCGYTG